MLPFTEYRAGERWLSNSKIKPKREKVTIKRLHGAQPPCHTGKPRKHTSISKGFIWDEPYRAKLSTSTDLMSECGE